MELRRFGWSFGRRHLRVRPFLDCHLNIREKTVGVLQLLRVMKKRQHLRAGQQNGLLPKLSVLLVADQAVRSLGLVRAPGCDIFLSARQYQNDHTDVSHLRKCLCIVADINATSKGAFSRAFRLQALLADPSREVFLLGVVKRDSDAGWFASLLKLLFLFQKSDSSLAKVTLLTHGELESTVCSWGILEEVLVQLIGLSLEVDGLVSDWRCKLSQV